MAGLVNSKSPRFCKALNFTMKAGKNLQFFVNLLFILQNCRKFPARVQEKWSKFTARF